MAHTDVVTGPHVCQWFSVPRADDGSAYRECLWCGTRKRRQAKPEEPIVGEMKSEIAARFTGALFRAEVDAVTFGVKE